TETGPPYGVRPVSGDDFRVDLRKVRKKVNYVRSIASVCASTKTLPGGVLLEICRDQAVDHLDRSHASRVAQLKGPLADIHAAKRRQAESGGGPLVADEADRLAILANAEAQDEQIAAIERERRRVKAALRAATSEDEIKAIMAE